MIHKCMNKRCQDLTTTPFFCPACWWMWAFTMVTAFLARVIILVVRELFR